MMRLPYHPKMALFVVRRYCRSKDGKWTAKALWAASWLSINAVSHNPCWMHAIGGDLRGKVSHEVFEVVG